MINMGEIWDNPQLEDAQTLGMNQLEAATTLAIWGEFELCHGIR